MLRQVIKSAACLFAVFVSFGLYAVEGNDYFGFHILFAYWAGVALFCVVWSLLTLLRILFTRTRMAALSEERIWFAIFVLCLMPYCQIEYVSSDRDIGTPCGKTAMARCADCVVSICSDCRLDCCGDSFCELCYDYNVTRSSIKKPVQNERDLLSTFRLPNEASR
jgi:hypothetical protein